MFHAHTFAEHFLTVWRLFKFLEMIGFYMNPSRELCKFSLKSNRNALCIRYEHPFWIAQTWTFMKKVVFIFRNKYGKKRGGEDLNCLIKLFVKGFECLYQYNLKSNLRNYYEI